MFHKKSLGQHFLRNQNILQKIANAAALTPDDTVLEVGPGEGMLTELLLARAGKVVAVEKDARLIPHLQQRFSDEIASEKLLLIYADILDFSDYSLLTTNYKLIANIPYYITGQFLRKFLQTEMQPQTMVLLLQKEVAQRIVAADGKESILSISVKCYGTPRMVGLVKAGAFSPPPQVDSAILIIENISKEFFQTTLSVGTNHPLSPLPLNQGGEAPSFTRGEGVAEKEALFFSLVKKGFAHPRKLLASNLGVAQEALVRCGIKENARAEEVSREQWRCLAL